MTYFQILKLRLIQAYSNAKHHNAAIFKYLQYGLHALEIQDGGYAIALHWVPWKVLHWVAWSVTLKSYTGWHGKTAFSYVSSLG